MTTWYAPLALLPDGVARSVLVRADGERIARVEAGVDGPPAGSRVLPGLVIPGLANVHSHAFHRALRGRTEGGSGSFWTWRESMYAVAQRLDPHNYLALARATYAEMALAGVTAVGEFHYVHHGPEGMPYDDPNAMQAALAQAAADAGLRVTLLDTCYLRGGFDRPLSERQRRFSDGDAPAWAERASARAAGTHVRLGAAVHSVRAVPADAVRVVAEWAGSHDAPLHVHVSEQPAENEECYEETGRTPTVLLDEAGALGARTVAVHATHLTREDIKLLGATGTGVCLCPTTERSLADGIGPAGALAHHGSPLSVGSDSHAVIDVFEEARAVELHERLVGHARGRFTPEALLEMATSAGMAALGWPGAGRIAEGAPCDLVAMDTGSVRMAGFAPEDAAAFAVFAASPADVTHVVSSGRLVVDDRTHVLGDVAGLLREAIAAVT